MSTIADGDASLALQTILQQQAQIAQDVGAIRTEVASVASGLRVVDQWRSATDKDMADHEARIRVLERFRWTLAGFAVIGSGVSGLIGWLVSQATHH